LLGIVRPVETEADACTKLMLQHRAPLAQNPMLCVRFLSYHNYEH